MSLFQSENLRARDHLIEDGWIILNWILDKYVISLWTVFNWISIGPMACFCAYGNEHSRCIKVGNFLSNSQLFTLLDLKNSVVRIVSSVANLLVYNNKRGRLSKNTLRKFLETFTSVMMRCHLIRRDLRV
jgi:hypothetical protein